MYTINGAYLETKEELREAQERAEELGRQVIF